jgi:hypothetical protein
VDPSLIGALALGVLGVLVWRLLQRPEPLPRCPDCKLEMERDAAMLDPNEPATRYPLAGGLLAEQAQPHLIVYHCPRCGRRARVRR